MDQSLKQRLIGAVVITALAAIFVPMLFDDPIEESVRTVSELELPATPVETFTETSERLPANEQQAWNGEEFNNEYDDSFAPEPFVEEPVTAESHDETNAMPKQPSPSPTPLSTLSKQEIWYVQMGSFSQRENAFTFRNTLTAQGYKATVDEVSGGKVKSYRLLVGPESDKKRAEAL
ncbi:MAG: SPOR domain-containing protein, partial [Gammaproteobacteria bacterium]